MTFSRIATSRWNGWAMALLLLVSFNAAPATAQTLPTSTVLTSAPNPSDLGEIVSLKAEVRSPGNTVDDGPGAGHVALGYYHSCALMEGGTVKCWGYDIYGALGDGTAFDDSLTPAEVPGLTGVKALAAGLLHSCALLNDGTVKCWGYSGYSALGYETPLGYSAVPADVPGLTGVTALAVSTYHSCALINDGTVKCWGYDNYGVFGDGTPGEATLIPTEVPGLTGVTALATSDYHACALFNGGAVKCWGYNAYGQLGDGTFETHYTPTDVPGLSGVKSLALSFYYSCAVLDDASVKCWGYNNYGLFGDDTIYPYQNSPVEIPGLTEVTGLAISAGHRCALISGGTVKCWGYNGYGQLGDGSTVDHFMPSEVSGLSEVSALAVGGNYGVDTANYTCALLRGGALKCWGYNGSGQLGDGSYTSQSSPVSIIEPVSGDVSFLDDATPIGSGSLANGEAAMNISTLTAGSHPLTASFVDATLAFDPSVSPVHTQIVQEGEDTDPPVISVPAPITMNTDPGLATAVVHYTVTASDNFDGTVPAVLDSGPASGTAFPLGVSTVTIQSQRCGGQRGHRQLHRNN